MICCGNALYLDSLVGYHGTPLTDAQNSELASDNMAMADMSSSGLLQALNEILSRPSSLACIECRRKHIKCDATNRPCARCAAAQLQCNSIPSRRGRKRHGSCDQTPARNHTPSMEGSATTNQSRPQRTRTTVSTYPPPDYISPAPTSGGVAHDTATGSQLSDPVEPLRFGSNIGCQDRISILPPQRSLPSFVDDEALVNLFYTFFHPAHPILVPRCMYITRSYPRYLQLVVQFVGSHYSSFMSSDTLRTLTAEELEDSIENNSCLV